jgi:hypothetical protein
MSSFLVSKTAIDRILNSLDPVLRDHRQLSDKLCEIGYTLFDKNDLGKAMLDLNTQAVNVRYGESHSSLDYYYCPALATMTQALKSLECWLYQCMEGDIPEIALYRFFDEMVKPALMAEIIYSSNEWDEAIWG